MIKQKCEEMIERHLRCSSLSESFFIIILFIRELKKCVRCSMFDVCSMTCSTSRPLTVLILYWIAFCVGMKSFPVLCDHSRVSKSQDRFSLGYCIFSVYFEDLLTLFVVVVVVSCVKPPLFRRVGFYFVFKNFQSVMIELQLFKCSKAV